MTIDIGCDFGDDPPPRHVNPTLTDDGYMAFGGQCIYVGDTHQQSQKPYKVEERSVERIPAPDDDWIFFDTYCVYIGD
jgi:hypothetical protein